MHIQDSEAEEIRSDFVGEPSYNPITEKKEPDYSSSKRFLRYVESFFILLPFFFLIICYLIACYNITGVITENSKYKQFVIHSLASLAEEGAIFDVNTNWAFIPTIG